MFPVLTINPNELNGPDCPRRFMNQRNNHVEFARETDAAKSPFVRLRKYHRSSSRKTKVVSEVFSLLSVYFLLRLPCVAGEDVGISSMMWNNVVEYALLPPRWTLQRFYGKDEF